MSKPLVVIRFEVDPYLLGEEIGKELIKGFQNMSCKYYNVLPLVGNKETLDLITIEYQPCKKEIKEEVQSQTIKFNFDTPKENDGQ